MTLPSLISAALRRIWRQEDGIASIQFVIAFPVFMLFLGMIYENGMVATRHVMLERGVDIAVREIRVGRLQVVDDDVEAFRQRVRARICEVASLIKDCDDNLLLEMTTLDLRAWSDPNGGATCIDRSTTSRPLTTFTPGGNNQLVFLRVCSLFDPVMPTTGLGYRVQGDEIELRRLGLYDTYALVATSAYVVEPFRRN